MAPPRRSPRLRTRPGQRGPLRGRDADRRRDRDLLRLHQAHPVQTRLPAQGGVQHGDEHPLEVAGSHRGRGRRQGGLDQARRPHRPRHDGTRKQGAADPHRRDGEDQAAHLPGRQLVRRTATRQPVGEDGVLRLHDPDHPDLRPGPARPGPQRPEHGHAGEPAEVPDRLRRRPHQAAGRGRKRRTAPGGAQRHGSAGDQQDLPLRPGSAARRRDHQPGPDRDRTARLLETDRRDRQGDLGAERARAAARRTDRQLQHLLRSVRQPERKPEPPRRRTAHLAEGHHARAARAGRVVRPDQGASRRTSCRA